MSLLKSLSIAVVAVPALLSAAQAAPGIRTGILSCDIGPSTGRLIGSNAPVDCSYNAFGGPQQAYTGTLSVTGLDVGISRDGKLTWTVVAPAYRAGLLSGTYRGATAGITLAAGGSINALVGGADGSVTLQPLSVSRRLGFGTSIGYASLTLDAEAPLKATAPRRPAKRHHAMH